MSIISRILPTWGGVSHSSLRTNLNQLNGIGVFSGISPMESPRKLSHKVTVQESISSIIHREIETAFPVHPFSKGVTESNAKSVLKRYLAMSQAFPLIQSGAFRPLILKSMRENRELPECFFKAFAVGMFLCNDEMGSHYILINGGNPRLPEILQTEDQSHASMLKKDLNTIFKEPIQPEFSPATRAYLVNLMDTLGSEKIEDLIAGMVAFENHAHVMIQALWDRLAVLYPAIDKETLEYFQIHVGGDDPAEAYHTQMTESLILDTKANANQAEFIGSVLRNFELNYNWCQRICEEDDTCATRT